MAHRGFFGMSESGKTSLAITASYRFRDKGIPRLILDPLKDPRWQVEEGTDWIGDDPDEFTRLWRANRQCALFIDEGGSVIGRYAGQMNEVVTMARHWGHETHVITQMPQQIDPIVRGQLREFYVFNSPKSVCVMFNEELGHPELLKARFLPMFHFYKCRRFHPAESCKIDVVTGNVTFVTDPVSG